MNGKDAIRSAMKLSDMVFRSYMSDLDDAEMMRRPCEGCNHIAWQTGHLIAAEVSILNSIAPGAGAELPAKFAEAHSKETIASDDASAFLSREEYLALWDNVRAATLQTLEAISEEQLNAESPEHFRSFCPTVGDVFLLIGTHPMMHAGQLVPVRRQLGKPVLF
ncbi:DinB superfamily protein [Novipirellula galeiformis]|uniref:DinB superfamily protein n=1 Tax=Novipirellula galeiformis TaxID=2528004 RepID=A0A5C6CLM2_9BACT|nr:DinB family protein [Novipirellula galeiformis]TWU24975.1 DinB superfamily protein [Novipirellula galeiformis]